MHSRWASISDLSHTLMGLGAYDASYCTTVPQTKTVEEEGVLGRKEKGGKGWVKDDMHTGRLSA